MAIVDVQRDGRNGVANGCVEHTHCHGLGRNAQFGDRVVVDGQHAFGRLCRAYINIPHTHNRKHARLVADHHTDPGQSHIRIVTSL